jgi:hypothetical protein
VGVSLSACATSEREGGDGDASQRDDAKDSFSHFDKSICGLVDTMLPPF